MPGEFRYHLAVSLLCYIISIRAVQYVTVPDVYTAVEEDIIIKCFVMFTENELLTPGNVTFEMVGTHLRCDVMEWFWCPPVYLTGDRRPENFSCGCLLQGSTHNYIFYLYLRSCPKVLDKSRYRCSPASGKDKHSDGQLRLVDFSKKPDQEILKCERETVSFLWEYNPGDFQNQLRISHINWLFYPDEGDPVFVATFENEMVHSQDKAHFGNRASVHSVPLKDTIPFLQVEFLKRADAGVFQIEIIFLSREAAERLFDEESGSSLNETLRVSSALIVEDDLEDNYTDLVRTQRALTENGLQDQYGLLGTGHTGNQSGHPGVLLADFIDKIKPTLRSSVLLHITEPLKEELSIVLKKISQSDELFLFCSVHTYSANTSFDHLSFVLKQRDTVLTTSHKQSFVLVKMDKKAVWNNYSCELIGDAVRCAYLGKPHKQKLLRQINSMVSEVQVAPIIADTFTLVDLLFMVQGLICVFLLIWNCTLVIRHLGFVCSRRARREQQKLEHVKRTSLIKRTAAFEHMKQKMQFQTVVPAQSPGTTTGPSTTMISTESTSTDPTAENTENTSTLSDMLITQDTSLSSRKDTTTTTKTVT